MRIIICLLLASLLYAGCDETVSFNETQPTDTKSLAEFPKRLWGSYLDKDGNLLLKISASLITKIYDYDIKVAIKDLDSTTHLVNDTVYTGVHEKIAVKVDGDSLLAHIHSVDTLFRISDKNVLKKFKGYYFLNYADSIYWHVDKLALSKGTLSIGKIYSDDDIKSLREITEAGADTCANNFNPTKKQFREFITKGGFTECDEYKRVRR